MFHVKRLEKLRGRRGGETPPPSARFAVCHLPRRAGQEQDPTYLCRLTNSGGQSSESTPRQAGMTLSEIIWNALPSQTQSATSPQSTMPRALEKVVMV